MAAQRLLWVFSILFSTVGSSQPLPQNNCSPLSSDIKQRIEEYLGQRLVSGTDTRPLIKSITPMRGSCYRKIVVAIQSTSSEVVMYLSPDERFLTSTLYDLSINPRDEVARIAGNVANLLMRDDSPRLGLADSRITLVEFVDFQCPYCKRFADWYSNLPVSLRSQTTLIFKNLPLPQHAWARSAAEYAACAHRQSLSAFQQVTSFLFENQPNITLQNMKDKLSVSFKQSNALNLRQLEACISGNEAFEVLEQDAAVAKQLNVSSTPTFFINGRRVLRVASAEELQHLLDTELANMNAIKAQASPFSAPR